MKFLPKNTLAYFNAAPQVHLHNLSELPTSVFAASTAKYRSTCGDHTSPQSEALTFYVLNHCASIVRRSFTANEPLPEWAVTIMTTYTDLMVNQGERMLHYLLTITTREMRHLQTKINTAKLYVDLKKQYGAEASAFIHNLCSNGDENVAMNKYMNHPPQATIGQYTKALAYAFHQGSWSSSYGGKAWGGIVDALAAMIDGTTSMEMLVDTGYTLAHNTAPIFNKGIIYSNWNDELYTILDVQRAGQLLDLMFSAETLGVKKTAKAIDAVTLIKANCPSEFKGFVDWKMVDAQRPDDDKNKNPMKYEKVIGAQKQAKAAPVKPLTTKSVKVGNKKAKVVGTWEVYPHQTVTVVERVGV